ncbi:MAG: hypothetical protein AAGF95_06225 [Chloroflexota bacterium]
MGLGIDQTIERLGSLVTGSGPAAFCTPAPRDGPNGLRLWVLCPTPRPFEPRWQRCTCQTTCTTCSSHNLAWSVGTRVLPKNANMGLPINQGDQQCMTLHSYLPAPAAARHPPHHSVTNI